MLFHYRRDFAQDAPPWIDYWLPDDSAINKYATAVSKQKVQ
jgi:hypothetical protein